MSWFEEWFNSPLYEKLYANRDEGEAELLAKLIVKEIPPENYPKILDLGCGRGRHSFALANNDYNVTGTDLSPAAINKARKTADERGLEQITFHIRDMREPLPETFHAIVNLFTTFGYFLDDEENLKVVKAVHQMLETGGRFMIDFLNAHKVRETLVPEESGTYGGLNYQIRRFIKNEMVHKEITFSGSSLSKPKTYRERVKLYDEEWFRNAFESCGFTVRNCWGDYKGSSFDEQSSPRLILLAEKG